MSVAFPAFRTAHRPSIIALAASCVLLLGAASPAEAVEFRWRNDDGIWSDPARWMGGVVPVSSPETELVFGGTGEEPYTSIHNLEQPFTLRRLALESTATATEIITGGSLEFSSSGLLPTTIEQNGSGNFSIENAILATSPLILTGTGVGLAELAGPISGASGVTVSGATFRFTSTESNYTGRTRVLTGSTLELAAPFAGLGINFSVQPVSLLGGDSAANPLVIDGGRMKLTPGSGASIILDAARVVNFGANGGAFDLRNVNVDSPGFQSGAIAGGDLALTTSADATAPAVVQWNGGELGLSTSNPGDGNWRASQNALRLASATGAGPLHFELTNGAMLNHNFLVFSTALPMPVTYRGVAGGNPTSGDDGLLNPAITRDTGRVFLASGSLSFPHGVTFERSLQVHAGNGAMFIDGPMRVAGGALEERGHVLFSGRSSGTPLGPMVNAPNVASAGQSMLILGQEGDDVLTIESGGIAAFDLRFRFDQLNHTGVLLDARAVVEPGAMLSLRQSISNFSPPNGSTTNVLNANVGNHIIRGDLVGQGSSATDAVVDLRLPMGNQIAANPAQGSLPHGGVFFEPSSKLVVQGSGFGGLRIEARARPDVIFNGGTADPISNAVKLDNLLTAARLATLTGSGGYLTPFAEGATWSFPAGGEWSELVPVGLRVSDSASGVDVQVSALSSFKHSIAVEAGATLETGTSAFTIGNEMRGQVTLQGSGSVVGNGGLVVRSGVLVGPGFGGHGTLSTGSLTLEGTLEIETRNGGAGDQLVVDGDLVLSTSSELRLPLSSGLGEPSYTIASYSGARTGAFGAFENLPRDYSVEYGSGSNDAIRLVFEPKATRVWTGATSGTWNSTDANWQGANFSQDENARFDDTAAGVRQVSITGGNVLPRSMVVHTAENFSISSSAGNAITGRAQLIKSGSGVLELSGSNAYVGGTIVDDGTLRLGSNDALPDRGSVTVAAGAVLDLNGKSDTIGDLHVAGQISFGSLKTGGITIAGGAVMQADVQLGGSVRKIDGGSATMSGSVDLNGISQLFDIAGSAAPELKVSGAVSNGGIIKTGAGTLLLSGTNSFRDALAIQSGTVQAGSGSAFGDLATVFIGFGAALDLNGFSSAIGALSGSGNIALGPAQLTITQNTATLFDGRSYGSGSVVKDGTGFLDLAGPSTFSGGLEIAGGQVRISHVDAAGTGEIQVLTGGTVSSRIPLQSPIVLAGGRLAGEGQAGGDFTTGDVTVTAASTIAAFDVRNPSNNSFLVFPGVLRGAGALQLVSGPNNPAPANGSAVRFINTTTPSDYSGTITLGPSTQLDVRSPGGDFSSIGSGRMVATAGPITSVSGATVNGTYSQVRVRSGGSAVFGNDVELTGSGLVNFNIGAIGPAGTPFTQTFGNLRIGNGQELTVNRGNAGFTLAFQSVTLTGGNATFSPGDPTFGGVGAMLELNDLSEAAPGAGFTMGGQTVLRLTGTSQTSGAIRVENGTLAMLGLLTTPEELLVANGTVGGTGRIAGRVAIGDGSGTAASAVLAPGLIGAIGSFATGPLSLGRSDAAWHFELASIPQSADLLNIEGALTLGDGLAALIAADLAPTPLLGEVSFTVAKSTGGVSGFFAGLPEGGEFTVGPNVFRITYAANGGNDIVVTAPEPAAALLLGAGATALLGFRRRRVAG